MREPTAEFYRSLDGFAATMTERNTEWALDREIVLSRVFDAPRELVYRAWTDPKHVTQWFAPKDFTCETVAIDVRVGGLWRFLYLGPNGIKFDNRIEFLERHPERERSGSVDPRQRMKKEGAANGQSGAVVVVQRASSDLKLNPHLHVLYLDGVYRELEATTVGFTELPRLSTHEVGEVLERALVRIVKHLRRRDLLPAIESLAEDEAADAGGLSSLAASAVSGQQSPAGPEWRRKSAPLPALVPGPVHYDKPLCASLDGCTALRFVVLHGLRPFRFTLHAATRAGAMDPVGREALCKYVLRPVVAQERISHGPDGLVRIALKKSFSDGTVAVDMDPLSLLCRLAASVPPPRLHTVRYSGVLAPASKLRSRIVPKPASPPANDAETETPANRPTGRCGRQRADPRIGRAACFGARPAATSALRCAPWSFTDSVQQAGLRPFRVVA